MTRDIWKADFFKHSAIFNSIDSIAQYFCQYKDWPQLDDLEKLFQLYNINIKPVAQDDKPTCFEDHYEPRIFLKKELQTRNENWHDFFNAMIWLQFPNIKKSLNQLHFYAAKARKAGSNRSTLENAITLFDECGCVIVSDREDLLDLIRGHEWHKLFWQNRDVLAQHLSCVVVGHAMHEKALKPYIGMTSHAILLSSTDLLKGCQANNFNALDKKISELWLQNKINSSRDLQAFPLLGMPGWHKDNQREEFYFNVDYFRAKRKR